MITSCPVAPPPPLPLPLALVPALRADRLFGTGSAGLLPARPRFLFVPAAAGRSLPSSSSSSEISIGAELVDGRDAARNTDRRDGGGSGRNGDDDDVDAREGEAVIPLVDGIAIAADRSADDKEVEDRGDDEEVEVVGLFAFVLEAAGSPLGLFRGIA